MRNKLLLVLGLVCVFSGIVSVQDTDAAIYKYVDKDGLINFADDLQSVPAPFRATAKIVSGEPEESSATAPAKGNKTKLQPGTGTPVAPPVVAPAAEQEKQQPAESRSVSASFGKRALTSVIIIVSAVFAFIILGILDTDHKKAVTIVRVILLWGMTVYLLYFHAGDVLGLFSSMGNKVQSVQQQSEEKGKKAAGSIKSLNALMDQAEKSSADTADAEAGEKE